MDRITTADGTSIYFKDWGAGPSVVFSHGWPLTADAWEDQMMFLAAHGYRCIAHDRRGHGRSGQSWGGNDMDTYVADLHELMTQLGVTGATFVGHSTGGGESVRYVARHGAGGRAVKLVMIGAVPPIMLKSEANPGGLPMSAFDEIRKGVATDRAQFWKDLAIPFFGANREGAKVSQGLIESFWRQGMMGSLKAEYDCVKAFSETDFTEDLKAVAVPTLILHGDGDQIVPIDDSAKLQVKLVKGATLKIIPGAPHGMASTHKDIVNAALLEFLQS
jgi:non-heme chloroperoxidase